MSVMTSDDRLLLILRRLDEIPSVDANLLAGPCSGRHYLILANSVSCNPALAIETARVHYAARRCGGGVAACDARSRRTYADEVMGEPDLGKGTNP